MALGKGAACVGNDAFAARFIAAVSAFASSMLRRVRTARKEVSVTSSTRFVSPGEMFLASDIDPAVTPGPATDASHFTV